MPCALARCCAGGRPRSASVPSSGGCRRPNQELERIARHTRESPERARHTAPAAPRRRTPAGSLGREIVWHGWRVRHEKAREARSAPGEDGRSDFEREYDLLARSALFDGQWYRTQYPDIDSPDSIPPALRRVRSRGGTRSWTAVQHPRLCINDPGLPGVNPLAHFLAGGATGASPDRPAADDDDGGPPPAVLGTRDRCANLSQDEYLAAVRQPEPVARGGAGRLPARGHHRDATPKHVSIDSISRSSGAA